MLAMFNEAQIRQIVEAAGKAPSIHNSQPWEFAVAGDTLEVRADPDRALPAADPDARALYISCGAALLNARVAMRMADHVADVRLLPHPEYPFTVLAVIRATPGPPPAADDRDLYDAIWQRHTDRGPYTDETIPDSVRLSLQQAASTEAATIRLLDRADATTVLAEAAAAGEELAADLEHRAELRRWVATGSSEHGIPAEALPAQPDQVPSPIRGDYGAAAPEADRPGATYEAFPQLAVLTTEHDEPEDWLRAGQALERVLLVATAHGVSASFLYHVIELRDMQAEDAPPWPWPENPQMIIRFGYGKRAATAPRRKLDDILRGPSEGEKRFPFS